jgi:hypothetical protein
MGLMCLVSSPDVDSGVEEEAAPLSPLPDETEEELFDCDGADDDAGVQDFASQLTEDAGRAMLLSAAGLSRRVGLSLPPSKCPATPRPPETDATVWGSSEADGARPPSVSPAPPPTSNAPRRYSLGSSHPVSALHAIPSSLSHRLQQLRQRKHVRTSLISS